MSNIQRPASIRNVRSPAGPPVVLRPSQQAERTLRSKLERENQELKRELAEQQRQHADDKHAADCQSVVLLHAQARGLDQRQVRRLANIVENQRRRFMRGPGNGQGGATFPVYDVLKSAVARVTGGLAPPRNGKLVGTADLPPPLAPSDGRPRAALSGAEKATREEQTRANEQRGRRLAEQRQSDREAYLAALRRHGLSDPSLGFPGGGPGFGM
ncbi:MAG: hypothetical protein RL685_7798 [Pseudomonadota bacterium]|jgi:hypothetical protein